MGRSKAHVELQKFVTSRTNTEAEILSVSATFMDRHKRRMFPLTTLKDAWNWASFGLQIILLHYHDSEPELISCAEPAHVSLHLSSELLEVVEKDMYPLGKAEYFFCGNCKFCLLNLPY